MVIAEPVTKDCLPGTEGEQCSMACLIAIHLPVRRTFAAHCQKGESLFLLIPTTLVIKVWKYRDFKEKAHSRKRPEQWYPWRGLASMGSLPWYCGPDWDADATFLLEALTSAEDSFAPGSENLRSLFCLLVKLTSLFSILSLYTNRTLLLLS